MIWYILLQKVPMIPPSKTNTYNRGNVFLVLTAVNFYILMIRIPSSAVHQYELFRLMILVKISISGFLSGLLRPCVARWFLPVVGLFASYILLVSTSG